MVTIAVAAAIGLMAIGVVAILISGIKSLTQGKQDFKRIGMMALPFVIFGVSFAVLGDFAKAGIMTTGIMMGAMVVFIAFTGLRGTFKI